MDIGEKSKEKFRSFVKDQLLAMQQEMLKGMQDGVEASLPNIEERWVEQALQAYLETASRQLFDFFDDNNIRIEIYRNWTYDVDNVGKEKEYSSRRECEKAAFQNAFNILENKL